MNRSRYLHLKNRQEHHAKDAEVSRRAQSKPSFLCARGETSASFAWCSLFLEPIHTAPDAIFQVRFMEIQHKSQALLRVLEVSQ
jgi:hypothetical protein